MWLRRGAEGVARTGQAGFVAETFAEVLHEVQTRISVQFESFEDRSTVPRDRSYFVRSKLAAGPVEQLQEAAKPVRRLQLLAHIILARRSFPQHLRCIGNSIA